MPACRSALLLLVACAVFALPASPQEPPPRDAQAMQILTQSFLRMGGAQKAAVTDLRVEGTLSEPNSPGTVIGTFVAKARGNDFAVDTTIGGETRTYRVLNGKGSVRGEDGGSPLRSYQTAGLALDILPLFSRWGEFVNESTEVAPVENVTVRGVPCYRVRIKPEEPRDDSMWKNNHGEIETLIDQASGLVLAIRYRTTRGPYVQDKVLIENWFPIIEPLAASYYPLVLLDT